MISLTAFVTSCKDDTLKDVDEDTDIDLKGEWYISGSSIGMARNDSVSYYYNDFIVGYQEFVFQPIKGEDNLYSLTYKYRDLPQKPGEALPDYFDRRAWDNYTPDELVMDVLPDFTWKVNRNLIYSILQYPNDGPTWQDNLQIAKIIKWSSKQFVLVTNHFNFPLSYGEDDLTYHKYYFTFNRIK